MPSQPQIIEAKLNQQLDDLELNPNIVLSVNNIPTNANYIPGTGVYRFETINGETITQEQYETFKSQHTVAEWKVIKNTEE